MMEWVSRNYRQLMVVLIILWGFTFIYGNWGVERIEWYTIISPLIWLAVIHISRNIYH